MPTTTSTAPEPTSNGLMVTWGRSAGINVRDDLFSALRPYPGGREESQRGRRQPGCNREGAEEIAAPTHRFSLLEITSGLPDDSRAAEEREADRRLRHCAGGRRRRRR